VNNEVTELLKNLSSELIETQKKNIAKRKENGIYTSPLNKCIEVKEDTDSISTSSIEKQDHIFFIPTNTK
jgi:hypothetical protein